MKHSRVRIFRVLAFSAVIEIASDESRARWRRGTGNKLSYRCSAKPFTAFSELRVVTLTLFHRAASLFKTGLTVSNEHHRRAIAVSSNNNSTEVPVARGFESLLRAKIDSIPRCKKHRLPRTVEGSCPLFFLVRKIEPRVPRQRIFLRDGTIGSKRRNQRAWFDTRRFQTRGKFFDKIIHAKTFDRSSGIDSLESSNSTAKVSRDEKSERFRPEITSRSGSGEFVHRIVGIRRGGGEKGRKGDWSGEFEAQVSSIIFYLPTTPRKLIGGYVERSISL